MRSTALKQFQRLETPGSWRPAPEAQLREVVVSIGEATLILLDPKSESPLTHWSLPAVQRLNPGQTPAIYIPVAAQGEGRSETLEIDDPWMIDAISKVQTAISARTPHPGRLRSGFTLAALAMMLAAGLLWLPPALRAHALRIMPPAERSNIGVALLNDMTRATGQPCTDPAADQVLRRLSDRIGLPDKAEIVVLRDGLEGALTLPGHLSVVDFGLIRNQDGPEALAGHLLAAETRAGIEDPATGVLDRISFVDLMGLLTRGSISPDALSGFGENLLAMAPKPAPDKALLDSFAAASVPITPYAQTLPDARPPPPTLLETDPFRSQPYPVILSDRDWVVLQQICTDPAPGG
ncbi:MAG: hypothetical protein ACK5LJ_10870 [Paracoccus sp. (in: a-proteobacteria)]